MDTKLKYLHLYAVAIVLIVVGYAGINYRVEIRTIVTSLLKVKDMADILKDPIALTFSMLVVSGGILIFIGVLHYVGTSNDIAKKLMEKIFERFKGAPGDAASNHLLRFLFSGGQSILTIGAAAAIVTLSVSVVIRTNITDLNDQVKRIGDEVASLPTSSVIEKINKDLNALANTSKNIEDIQQKMALQAEAANQNLAALESLKIITSQTESIRNAASKISDELVMTRDSIKNSSTIALVGESNQIQKSQKTLQVVKDKRNLWSRFLDYWRGFDLKKYPVDDPNSDDLTSLAQRAK